MGAHLTGWPCREEEARYRERLQGLQLRHELAAQKLSSETGELGTLEAHADQLEAMRQVPDMVMKMPAYSYDSRPSLGAPLLQGAGVFLLYSPSEAHAKCTPVLSCHLASQLGPGQPAGRGQEQLPLPAPVRLPIACCQLQMPSVMYAGGGSAPCACTCLCG